MRTGDFGPRLVAEGQSLIASTPEEFATFLTRESERWGPVLRRMNIEG
jgi:tripartite-type tricarboxylate transporter receptor subunit TctC